MAYYDYYQSSQPSWGTQQYEVVPPPVPQYQPQPFWRGADYYSAHPGIRDNTIFDHVMYKIRDRVGARGVNRRKARRWWEKIYTGLVNPAVTLPKDVGAAAAYEALRCWETHGSIYAPPLSADTEREREALIGLAAAEATMLWEYSGRRRDRYGRMEASEVAAATASRLFSENNERGPSGGGYGGHSISRRRSLSAGRYNSLDDAPYEDGNGRGYLGLNNTYSTRRDIDIRGRRRSLTPTYSVRSVSPTPFGDGFRRSPSPYGGGLGLGHSSSPYAYGNRLPNPGPYAYGMSSPSSSPIRAMGSPISTTSHVDGGVVLNNSNVTYDPILGPGISGTYYPNVARAQMATGAGYMPGNEYAGGHYLNPPTLGQMGRRRSHSFSDYSSGRRWGY